MDILYLLADKSIKATEKREQIAQALENGETTVKEIKTYALDDKTVGIILEAMESVSRTRPQAADIEWLNYAGTYITAASNTVKREASRVVGNISHLFPDKIDGLLPSLLENTKSDGTVIRWGSAYALGQIVRIPKFANSNLFDVLTDLAEQEAENGVKNQYSNGLKKAKQLRK